MNTGPDRVVIAGAGPAGIALALACRELGLHPLLVDPAPPGGILRRSGWPVSGWLDGAGLSGIALADLFAAALDRAQIPLLADAAAGFDPAGKTLFLRSGKPLPYAALAVATGVRFREAGLPGQADAEGYWFFNHPRLEPKPGPAAGTVVVLGGGDNAFSTAHIEAQAARRVVIAMRGHEPRAQAQAMEAAARLPNVTLRRGWKAVRLVSDPAFRIDFETPEGPRSIACDRAWANLGYAPNGEWTGDAVRKGREGFIEVDAAFRTSAPFVWAVGEVNGPSSPCVAVAVGQAPVAAHAIAAALRNEKTLKETFRALEERPDL